MQYPIGKTNLRNWNTWDVRCMNGVTKIPDMAQVRVGIYNDFDKSYQDEFFYDKIKRFGAHDLEGEYFDIDLTFEDFIYTMEFASENDAFVYKITPQNKVPYLKFFVGGLFRWNANGEIKKDSDQLILKGEYGEYKISVSGNVNNNIRYSFNYQGFIVESEDTFYIRCNNNMTASQMEQFISEKRKKSESKSVKGSGYLEEVPEAISKAILWNTIYEPLKDRVCTPVSRVRCLGRSPDFLVFGTYVLFCWDTFFNSLLGSVHSKALAYFQIKSILDEMDEEIGMIPNCSGHFQTSRDRSQPPVGSYCVLKLYYQFNDISLLEDTFDKLYTWNRWWINNRDGNKDGLLEWGSHKFPEGFMSDRCSELFEVHNLQGAKNESGMDNNQMYDDVKFNKDTNTMELIDVGLNSLFAMDLKALSIIAEILGKEALSIQLKQEFEKHKELINTHLWNEGEGIYCNRLWDGTWQKRISPTSFYPLIAEIASEEKAKRMMREHLLNEDEFWGEYVIPCTPRNDPAFNDNDYWRGRIWAPVNFLVAEGLRNSNLIDVLKTYSDKSLNLFMNEWRRGNIVGENYQTLTGKVGSTPFYTWGALLGYIGLNRVVGVNPWKGMYFGTLDDLPAAVRDFPVGDDKYSITTGEGLIIERNKKTYIKTTMPAIIYKLKEAQGMLSFELIYNEHGTVELHRMKGITKIEISHKDGISIYEHSGNNVVHIDTKTFS